MADFAGSVAKLKADVTAQTNLTQSISGVITGLVQMVADLKMQVSQDPATQAALDDLITQVEGNNASLTQSVLIGTPAGPPAPPPPAPEPDPAPAPEPDPAPAPEPDPAPTPAPTP